VGGRAEGIGHHLSYSQWAHFVCLWVKQKPSRTVNSRKWSWAFLFVQQLPFAPQYAFDLAWMPARTPPTTFFGLEVRSGLDPLRSNYDQAKNERANQIARAGFIRWWTGDLQGRNHHVIKERLTGFPQRWLQLENWDNRNDFATDFAQSNQFNQTDDVLIALCLDSILG